MSSVRQTVGLIFLLHLSLAFAQGQQGTRHLLDVLSGESLVDSQAEEVKCGLPISAHALANRAVLTVEQGRALEILMQRVEMQKQRAQGLFRVHYDTTGTNAPALLDASHQRIAGSAEAYVDSVLAIAAYAFAYETTTLGYAVPPSDNGLGGGPEYDIYVVDLANAYGDTEPDGLVAEGGRCTSFIHIDNDFTFVLADSNKGLPALRVTLAHELHHLIQLGSYGYWYNDVYFYEITSTWMEDVVYTTVNDYYHYMTRYYSQFLNPQTPFASGSDLIMYTRGIWGQYVQKRFGPGTMRRSWEHIASARPLPAIDLALRESGADLADGFAQWTVWNHFTGFRADTSKYYPEGGYYPLMAELPIGLSASGREISDVLAPLAARYYQVPSGSDTVTVAVVNADAARAITGSESTAPYTLSLRLGRPDDSYEDAGAGIFAKLTVDDPSVWRMWFILGKGVNPGLTPDLADGVPFPHPFLADGLSVVRILLAGTAQLTGDIAFFDAGMNRVRSTHVTSSLLGGRQVVEWDGRQDDGALAATGVYFFVLELKERTVTGKLALVRR